MKFYNILLFINWEHFGDNIVEIKIQRYTRHNAALYSFRSRQ